MDPRLCEIRWKSCVLFIYCSQENATFSSHFTQPGAHLLEIPHTMSTLGPPDWYVSPLWKVPSSTTPARSNLICRRAGRVGRLLWAHFGRLNNTALPPRNRWEWDLSRSNHGGFELWLGWKSSWNTGLGYEALPWLWNTGVVHGNLCFQARDTSHSINIDVRNSAKKFLIHSNEGEACKSRLSLGQCQTIPIDCHHS